MKVAGPVSDCGPDWSVACTPPVDAAKGADAALPAPEGAAIGLCLDLCAERG